MEVQGEGAIRDTRERPVAASVPRDPETIANDDVSSDDEHYLSSFAGLHNAGVIPLGMGHGPNQLRIISDGRIHVGSHEIGHPIIARWAIGDDELTIGFIEHVAPGSFTFPDALAPNDIYLTGPGMDASSVAAAGSRFDYTVLSIDDVRERAEDMRLHLGAIDRPGSSRLAPRPAMVELRRLLGGLLLLPIDPTPPRWLLDELLTSATMTLAEAWPERPRRSRASMHSQVVVKRCLDYAQHLERRPLMHELCRAAGVSERMVRKAFTDLFDLPPSVYFRLRALSRVHQRLAHPGAKEDTVTTIAQEAGFAHLGRFAAHYREVYGEPPSQTLRRQLADGTHAGSTRRYGAAPMAGSEEG